MGSIKEISDFSVVFDNIFRECYTPLCRFACNILDDIELSQDIVQEVFEEIWKRKDNLIYRKDIENYLFISVRNNCFAYLKRKKVVKVDIKDCGDCELCDDSKDVVLGERQRTKILKVVNSLPEQRCIILKLLVWEGYSYAEVAEKLDISLNTVKTHVKLAYKELREKLKSSEIFAFHYFFRKVDLLNEV